MAVIGERNRPGGSLCTPHVVGKLVYQGIDNSTMTGLSCQIFGLSWVIDQVVQLNRATGGGTLKRVTVLSPASPSGVDELPLLCANNSLFVVGLFDLDLTTSQQKIPCTLDRESNGYCSYWLAVAEYIDAMPLRLTSTGVVIGI